MLQWITLHYVSRPSPGPFLCRVWVQCVWARIVSARTSWRRAELATGGSQHCAVSSVEKAGWDRGQTVSWRALDTIPVPSSLIKLRFSELKMEMLQWRQQARSSDLTSGYSVSSILFQLSFPLVALATQLGHRVTEHLMLHANTLRKSNCDVVSSNCVKTRYTIAIIILDLVIYDVRDLIGLLATSTRRLDKCCFLAINRLLSSSHHVLTCL